jgi:hypothetical protein
MNTKIISGNFNVEIEGDFDASKTIGEGENAMPVGVARDQSAIAYISQRDGLSAVYKPLLKEGQKRNELAFSDEVATTFASKLEAALAPYGTFAVSVSEHVAGETAVSRKQATAMWEQAKANPALVAALGVDANASDEVGIEACHKFLSGLRKPSGKKSAE